MQFEINWKPSNPRSEVCFAIQREGLRLVEGKMPDLADLFPFRNQFRGKTHFGKEWAGMVIEFDSGLQIPQIGELDSVLVDRFSKIAESAPFPDYQSLKTTLDSETYSFQRFCYVGPIQDEKLCWQHIASVLVDWINDLLLPEVLEKNQMRVLRAVPQPPLIDFNKISNALWVLEGEKEPSQGTGFMLDNIGLVSCAHVITPCLQAFRAIDFETKYKVEVLASDADIDLAILKINDVESESLAKGTADFLERMDHLVISGYPNYRFGDTGTIVPGFVVGFRTISSIRRILTNAPIVAGTSGGPVVDKNGKVIGVAVTGADRMEKAQDTEHHSIVPIDALSFLG